MELQLPVELKRNGRNSKKKTTVIHSSMDISFTKVPLNIFLSVICILKNKEQPEDQESGDES